MYGDDTATDFDGIRVIARRGPITIGSGDQIIREYCVAAINDGMRGVVLDFSNILTVDSSGWGELGGSLTTCLHRNVMFAFACIHPKFEELLEITNFRTIFPVFPDVETAVRTLGAIDFATYTMRSHEWTDDRRVSAKT